jgi:tripartite-type tricarboxylate transporter receptor subunit TctC
MTDLIGGQVMMFTADFAVTVPQHKAGKIRGLAVTSQQALGRGARAAHGE